MTMLRICGRLARVFWPRRLLTREAKQLFVGALALGVMSLAAIAFASCNADSAHTSVAQTMPSTDAMMALAAPVTPTITSAPTKVVQPTATKVTSATRLPTPAAKPSPTPNLLTPTRIPASYSELNQQLTKLGFAFNDKSVPFGNGAIWLADAANAPASVSVVTLRNQTQGVSASIFYKAQTDKAERDSLLDLLRKTLRIIFPSWKSSHEWFETDIRQAIANLQKGKGSKASLQEGNIRVSVSTVLLERGSNVFWDLTVDDEALLPQLNLKPPADTVEPAWYPCQRGQIKANLNSGLYHVPTGRHYARTWKHVKCFNTKAQAEEAGFQAAQQ